MNKIIIITTAIIVGIVLTLFFSTSITSCRDNVNKNNENNKINRTINAIEKIAKEEEKQTELMKRNE